MSIKADNVINDSKGISVTTIIEGEWEKVIETDFEIGEFVNTRLNIWII